MRNVQVGQRIRLLHAQSDAPTLTRGATGTVNAIAGNFDHRDLRVCVSWDCGATEALVCPPDSFVVLD